MATAATTPLKRRPLLGWSDQTPDVTEWQRSEQKQRRLPKIPFK